MFKNFSRVSRNILTDPMIPGHPTSAERAHPQYPTLVEVHDRPALLAVTLAFMREFSPGSHACRDILDWVMAGLLLNDLVMLAAQDIDFSPLAQDHLMKQFWLLHSPQWLFPARVWRVQYIFGC